MNGNHVRPKLKIRNRVLAIIVAFLLLSLMVPKMSFADGATDQSKDIANEEVNNEATDNAAAANEGEPAANDLVVSGRVHASTGGFVVGAKVSAYNNDGKLGESTTGTAGNYSIQSTSPVVAGQDIMLMITAEGYAFEVVHTTIGTTSLILSLNSGASVDVKPVSEAEDQHDSWTVKTSADGYSITETFDESKTFSYVFPVGGTFLMTHNAKLLFHYVNSKMQDINVEIKGNGYQDWYRAYYWGFQHNGAGSGEMMKVNQLYNIESGTYTIALAYIGQAAVKFASVDANHEGFNFTFVKNGATVQELTQTSFDTTTHDGTTCSVKEDGSIQMYFEDGDDVNDYEVIATVKPIAKAGYKVAGWTCNGETFKVGDSFDAALMETYNFAVTYEVDASKAPATGDMNFVWIIALSGLALASAAGALRFRKNH